MNLNTNTEQKHSHCAEEMAWKNITTVEECSSEAEVQNLLTFWLDRNVSYRAAYQAFFHLQHLYIIMILKEQYVAVVGEIIYCSFTGSKIDSGQLWFYSSVGKSCFGVKRNSLHFSLLIPRVATENLLRRDLYSAFQGQLV